MRGKRFEKRGIDAWIMGAKKGRKEGFGLEENIVTSFQNREEET